MIRANYAASNTQNQPSAPPKLHWRQMDILRYIEDECGDGERFVTVTPGRPPRAVQRAHDYFRTHKQIKPLVDLGLLEYLRTEIYPSNVSCEIFVTTPAGKAAVVAYYASVQERDRERDEARHARIQAEQKSNKRIALIAALEEQFAGNYYLPALHDLISESQTPFLDVPLPIIAPSDRITVREWLIVLWYEALPDELQKTISDFFIWSDAIGDQDAAAMLRDKLDEDDDDETDGDLHSPYGRIS